MDLTAPTGLLWILRLPLDYYGFECSHWITMHLTAPTRLLWIINMSSNALAAIAPFVSQMDNALRTFGGFDLKQWISTLDLATVGIVVLVAGLGVLLFNLLGFKFADFTGNAAGYQPFGRSLLAGAAEAWQNRDNLGLDPYFSGVRGRSLDINNVSNVLDAISKAVLEYGSPILSTAASSSSHNTITHHPKFPNAAAASPQEQAGDWGWN